MWSLSASTVTCCRRAPLPLVWPMLKPDVSFGRGLFSYREAFCILPTFEVFLMVCTVQLDVVGVRCGVQGVLLGTASAGSFAV